MVVRVRPNFVLADDSDSVWSELAPDEHELRSWECATTDVDVQSYLDMTGDLPPDELETRGTDAPYLRTRAEMERYVAAVETLQRLGWTPQEAVDDVDDAFRHLYAWSDPTTPTDE